MAIGTLCPIMNPAERPRVGVSILAIRGEKILLGRRLKEPNRGLWVLPGGGVESYERAEATAEREIFEETGARVSVKCLVAVTEIIRPQEEHRVILTFLADLMSSESELRQGDDLGSPALFTKAELRFLEISDVVRPILEFTGWLSSEASEVASDKARCRSCSGGILNNYISIESPI